MEADVISVKCNLFYLRWERNELRYFKNEEFIKVVAGMEIRNEWDVLGIAAAIKEGGSFIKVTKKLGTIYVPCQKQTDPKDWTIEIIYPTYRIRLIGGDGVGILYPSNGGELLEFVNLVSIPGSPVWYKSELVGMKVKVFDSIEVIVVNSTKIKTIKDIKEAIMLLGNGFNQCKSILNAWKQD